MSTRKRRRVFSSWLKAAEVANVWGPRDGIKYRISRVGPSAYVLRPTGLRWQTDAEGRTVLIGPSWTPDPGLEVSPLAPARAGAWPGRPPGGGPGNLPEGVQ